MFKRLCVRFICFLYVGLLLLSCNQSYTSPSPPSILDSLFRVAYDTIRDNPARGLEIIESSKNYIHDSIDFWKLKSLYSHYYLVTGQTDSVRNILPNFIRYANTVSDAKVRGDFLLIAYNQLGNCYSQLNELDSAELYFQKSLQYSFDKAKIENLINLADINIWKGNYAEGTSYFIQALAISDSLDIPDSGNYPIYAGLGQAYLVGMSDFGKSDFYFRKAEQYLESQSRYDKIIFYNNHGTYYYFKEEYKEALSCFLKARSLVGNTNASHLLSLINTNLGDIYFQLNMPDSAKICLDDSYQFNMRVGDNSSLFYIATIRAALALQENKTELAERILIEYPERKEIRAEILRIRYNILANAYARNKDFNKAYVYKEQLKQIDDSLRSQSVENAIAEIEMRYKQDTTLLKKELQIQQKEDEVQTLRATNIIIIFIAFIACLAALLVYSIYKRKRDVNFLRFYETTSKLRLQNIRNRISPHFMFNILNRQINQEEDPEKNAPLYELVSLLRKSLQMTEDVAVTLFEESEFVKSYLKLETSKSEPPLQITWEVDKNIDASNWKVLAMIIQIPVENALKYAVRNDDEGELVISIKELGESLHIEIRDNGPGYDPAVIAGNKGTGTGLKVLLSTINILNKSNKEKIIFRIINLRETGSSGTAVQIIVPKDYDFGLTNSPV